jgi:hypothetical protein
MCTNQTHSFYKQPVYLLYPSESQWISQHLASLLLLEPSLSYTENKFEPTFTLLATYMHHVMIDKMHHTCKATGRVVLHWVYLQVLNLVHI